MVHDDGGENLIFPGTPLGSVRTHLARGEGGGLDHGPRWSSRGEVHPLGAWTPSLYRTLPRIRHWPAQKREDVGQPKRGGQKVGDQYNYLIRIVD